MVPPRAKSALANLCPGNTILIWYFFRINHLFKNIESDNELGGPDRKQVTNLNRISGDTEEYQNRVSASVDDTGSSQLKLNLNLDVQVQNGKPSRLSLPHGELVVMFLPKRGGQNQPGGKPGKLLLVNSLPPV